MTIRAFLLFILLFQPIAGNTIEYEKPNKVDVAVTADVSFDRTSCTFFYSYRLNSSFNSIQEVRNLRIQATENTHALSCPKGGPIFLLA